MNARHLEEQEIARNQDKFISDLHLLAIENPEKFYKTINTILNQMRDSQRMKNEKR